ncbi:MAG: peptide-methionine (S)-S-oxide reductase MsrA [Gammaproteobacteria bacterium]|nr:peptide-methionine (S)-S-oxide reductase MsrA [Gammaproteobacteria bacterium]
MQSIWMIRHAFFLLMLLSQPLAAKTAEAIFAGGCFWCVEADFDKVPGVLKTTSGYDGGTTPDPDYQTVSSGKTQYVESVRVSYDADKVTYQQLLHYYWRHIDPTAKEGQFCDHGRQYRSVVFFLNEAQKQAALATKAVLEKQFPNVYTDILASTHFYPAEAYHQNYYQKNPLRYKFYRYRCGRDARIKELWHDKTT